nr:hypothetical protein [Tanacetum cinerariifolium]
LHQSRSRLLSFPSGFPLGMVPPKNLDEKNSLVPHDSILRSKIASGSSTNLYKALVKAYESDKIILDTYEETVTLKRCRYDDADKDEEPYVRPDQGSKRRKEGKEPESARAPTETATRSIGSILNGFLNNRNHHLQIVIGTRLCRLSTEAFNRG